MAAYSLAHYGLASLVLHPRVIVLHFTDSSTYASAHDLFISDVPNMGVLPGVVSHFIIDKRGTIYQQLPLSLEGRHAVGLNYCAVGIEFVQEQAGQSSHWADQQILQRRAQLEAGLRLVAWLQRRYRISAANVIGHAMANQSPYFKDLKGWRNDHTDWLAADVAQFRAGLERLSR
jgi:N-acetyl-anhydromuramyl-L-alanine amidase AmpD